MTDTPDDLHEADTGRVPAPDPLPDEADPADVVEQSEEIPELAEDVERH
jgi:hypothetical protein